MVIILDIILISGVTIDLQISLKHCLLCSKRTIYTDPREATTFVVVWNNSV